MVQAYPAEVLGRPAGYSSAAGNKVVEEDMGRIRYNIVASLGRKGGNDVPHQQPFPSGYIVFLEWVFFGRVQDILDELWPHLRC